MNPSSILSFKISEDALSIQSPGNALSPLSSVGAAAPLSLEMRNLSLRPDFKAALDILASPRLRLEQRRRETDGRISILTTFASPGNGNQALVALYRTSELTLFYFSSSQEYLDWWLQNFATLSAAASQQLSQHAFSLSTLQCLFHLLDTYRRIAFESLLRYEEPGNLTFSLASFNDTLATALRKQDLRWLTPAFFALTPGLPQPSPALAPQNFASLSDLGLITLSETETCTFTPRGQQLGEDFAVVNRPLGLAATLLHESAAAPQNVFFLVATEKSNQFFSFAPTSDANWLFRQETHSLTSLKKKLSEWLEELLKKAADKNAVAAVKLDPKRIHCQTCGNLGNSGAKFCINCGSFLTRDK